jgi:hypothetical protein
MNTGHCQGGAGLRSWLPGSRAAPEPRNDIISEAGAFIAERNTAPGDKLPLNTNGGGLSYMHSGIYGMCALQESVRQMRGTAPAQIEGTKISVCHRVGGMFAASGTIIISNEPPQVTLALLKAPRPLAVDPMTP